MYAKEADLLVFINLHLKKQKQQKQKSIMATMVAETTVIQKKSNLKLLKL